MSKKLVKKKLVKSAPAKGKGKATASKGKPAAKKPKLVKTAKKSPAKKVAKPIKKAVAKKIVKKISKKPIIKTAKPVKKAKVIKPVIKKVVKVVKPTKPVKPSKPTKVVKPVEVKKAKPAEKEKPVKVIPAPKVLAPKPPKAERGRKKKKKADDDDEPVIGNDPLLEEIIKATVTKKTRQPKVPKILKTFVNPMAALAVAAPEGGKKGSIPKKEPKGKFELEYVVRTSAGILYEFLTTPSGLSEWFADDVNIRDGIFTFFWDGSEQKARLLNFKEDKHVRMQWVDKAEGSFFEFKIQKDELTGDISLIITDFADEGSDQETSKRLWDSQVNKLLHVIGSY